MRQISIRQFQQNMYKELEDLPVVITKRGIPQFDIVPHDVTTTPIVTTNNVTTYKKPIEPEGDPKELGIPKYHQCEFKPYTCPTPATVQKGTHWFCPLHAV